MLRKLQLIVLLMAMSMVTFAQVSDDFEGYNAGEQLVSQAVAQGLEYWTTWSETPGSAEDPMISSDFGSNSVVIAGTNDAVLLLGDKTVGVHDLEFDVYVPTGFFGYFNVLQAFAGANSEWGMQAFLDADGNATVDAGGEGAGAFTYSYDTWFTVKMNIDLDSDFAEMWVDGTSIITWVWSGGSFGTGTLNQIGAVNLYAWADNGTPGAHFDNISFEPVTSVDLLEDFESYTAGDKLVEQALAQGLDYWTCWSGDGGAGGAEDGTISTEQTFTGDNSVMCDGTNDFVMLFGDKTAGKYSVDFYMYIPSGFVGYYNILQAWGPGGTGATWGLEIYFDPGGIANVTAENQTPFTTFNYPYDTWFHMENIINLNMDEAMLMIDGTEVATWEWSVGASGGGINQLAAMDIYAATTNGTPKFYVDDIQLIELEPPVGPPAITVTPQSFNVSLDAGASTTETLTIGNSGIATLDWNVFPEFTWTTATDVGTYNTVIDYTTVQIPEVQMTKGLGDTHPGNTDDVVTLNYDGENANGVGLTNGGTFEYGAKFPTTMTNPYIMMEINEIQVFINDIVTASTLYIYGHGSEGAPGEVLLEQDFTSIIGWNNVTLSSPVMITGGDYWVTCKVTHDAGAFPAGNDAGLHVENGDWFKSGVAWVPMHIANPTLDANWNIRAIAEGTPIDAWMMLNPNSGETASGDTDDVTVTFDASELTSGTYTANIVVNSNDPNMPMTLVPVTLQITGGPALDPPTNLVAELIGTNDVELTWTSPGPAPAFFEGFESTFPPSGWAKISPDGGTGWEQLAVGTTPLPGWTGSGIATAPPDGGDYQAYCTWSTGGATSNDQWIVTPQLTVGAGSMLEFYMIYYIDSYIDHVEVLISTTSQTEPSAFDIVVDEFDFSTGSSTDWEMYSYDLTDFVSAGTNVYIAFRETVADNFNDGSAISIDNVYVGEGTFLAEVEPSINPNSSVSFERDLNTVHVPTNYGVRGVDELLGFNVYRNTVKINTSIVTEPMYMDNDLPVGTYTYYVTAVYDEGESGASNEQVIDVIVSVNELNASTFSIYPNPANGMVNIKSDVTMKSVKIMNYAGQVVYNRIASGNDLQINTSEIAAGVYVLQIETEEGTSTQKLIIE